MQDKNGNLNMTDDEFFDCIINGAESSFTDGLAETAVGEKLERVLSEVQSLREQLFTVSMASVSNGENKSYESYNNIMVDELGEIKESILSLLEIGKNGLTVNTAPMTAKLDEVKKLVNEVKKGTETEKRGSDSDEIAELKKTIAEQKETQSAMFELLNKMMKKLEEQEKNNVRLADEIAATVAKEPVAKKEHTAGKDGNKEVMAEIESIKQTINAMQGNENNSDDDLESSIAKLKAELSQMAGIIDGNK